MSIAPPPPPLVQRCLGCPDPEGSQDVQSSPGGGAGSRHHLYLGPGGGGAQGRGKLQWSAVENCAPVDSRRKCTVDWIW